MNTTLEMEVAKGAVKELAERVSRRIPPLDPGHHTAVQGVEFMQAAPQWIVDDLARLKGELAVARRVADEALSMAARHHDPMLPATLVGRVRWLLTGRL